MRFNSFILQIFFLLLFLSQTKAQTKNFISHKSTNIRYEGRIGTKENKAAELYWSGTSIKVNFKGTGLKALMQHNTRDNFYNIIIDGKDIVKINPDTAKKFYMLASNLKPGNHTLEIYKITEWDKGRAWFYGLELDKGTKLLAAPPAKKRKIEFYGNSITCGYGALDYSGNDSGAGQFENNYLSYAALTARHFNAEANYIAKSGIGITVSWFPLTMPEMYDRIDPQDPQSKWDFAQYTPDIVVVNLFQNDSWLVNRPEHEQFKARFGSKGPEEETIVTAYYQFVKALREKYPQAHIICALGNMDATKEGAPWPGYITSAVARLNDKKMYTHFFPYKNTPGHPRVEEQKAMGDSLIGFIEKNIKW
ncbi:SGNH/GDSL hydrolase family protein [Adhaeribacter aquaticus]|uniref:SGNH/GDSL hydrolase family protein n=1 Tax=Adhaeribacter aquaticus TaxID=299567 RepID=UPI0004221D9F|nr:SGNH/GDSL hydrolase family protein [Adhaeribacter aquaticus]